MGHVLVMGRRTYDSIGRPLPGRTTIVVVTRQPGWQPAGGRIRTCRGRRRRRGRTDLAGELDAEVFVVGGGEIYAADAAATPTRWW